MVQTVQKTVENPQAQFLDEIVGMPVVVQRKVPMVQMQKTVEVPQVESDKRGVASRNVAKVISITKDVDNDVGHPLSVNTDVMNDDITQQVQKQQQHWHSNHSKQAMQRRGGKEERERGRKGEGERGQAGRKKEEEKQAVGERGKQVEKDVMDWIVVRRNIRQRKRTIQIFVKVNESKAFPLDVSPDDRVNDVIRQIQSDEDAYVTMHGRVLRKSEQLKSCEVTDGCTIQVTSRLRGGGKHKNKRSMTETKRNVDESGKKDQQVGSMSDKCQEMTQAQKDVLIQTIEGNEGYRRLIKTISETEDWEYDIQCFRKQLLESQESKRKERR